jgi:sodium-coupled neutral amino acid transporter 9
LPKNDEVSLFFERDYSEEPTDFFSYKNLWKLQGSVPFILGFFTFPLMNFKSPTFFTKFNVLGTISVLYLIGFTISKSYECGFNLNFVDPKSLNYVKLANWNFPALTGTLALSFFIHNAVLTILRNQKHPENNARDLSIGYALAATCYLLIGTLFFLAFPGRRECIADNFLNNFGSGDVMSATARLFLLFQMITVLPLLLYLIRVQFSYLYTGSIYPGLAYTCLINILVITVAVFFAVVYPHVGSILRYRCLKVLNIRLDMWEQ